MKVNNIAKVVTGILTVGVFTFFFLFIANDSRIAKNVNEQNLNEATGIDDDEAEASNISTVAVPVAKKAAVQSTAAVNPEKQKKTVSAVRKAAVVSVAKKTVPEGKVQTAPIVATQSPAAAVASPIPVVTEQVPVAVQQPVVQVKTTSTRAS